MTSTERARVLKWLRHCTSAWCSHVSFYRCTTCVLHRYGISSTPILFHIRFTSTVCAVCIYIYCSIVIYTFIVCIYIVYIYSVYIYIYRVAPPKIYLFEVHNGGCHMLGFISLTFIQDNIAWCHTFSRRWWGNIP